MLAKEFFERASYDQKFDINVNGLWMRNLTSDEIIYALDHCMLFEEIFDVALFGNPIMHENNGKEDNMLVVLSSHRDFPIDYEWEIHRLLYK